MAIIINGTNNTIGTSSYSDAIKIDSNGRLIRKKVPAFTASMKLGGAAFTPSSSIGGLYPYNTVVYDNYSGYNTTTYRYTIPVTGHWEVFYSHISGTSGVGGGAGVWKNGSSMVKYMFPRYSQYTPTGGRWTYTGRIGEWGCMSAKAIIFLEAGDYIDVRSTESGAYTVWNDDINSFGGFLVSGVV